MVCTAKLPFFLGKSWLNNGMLMYSWGTVSYFQANQHAETCSMLIIWFLVIYFFLIFSLLVLLFSATMPYFPGIAIRIYIYKFIPKSGSRSTSSVGFQDQKTCERQIFHGDHMCPGQVTWNLVVWSSISNLLNKSHTITNTTVWVINPLSQEFRIMCCPL